MIETTGSILAIAGSIISLYGAYTLNIRNDPLKAQYIWSVSNVLLFSWSVGYYIHLWVDGLAAGALVFMYGYFTASNIYGLWKYHWKDWFSKKFMHHLKKKMVFECFACSLIIVALWVFVQYPGAAPLY